MAEIHSHSRPPGPLSAFGLSIVVVVIVVDQITKLIVQARLPVGYVIDVLPILALLHVHNTGIAFSMLANSGVSLVALPLVVTAIVLAFWAHNREGGKPAAAGFALILGGAIGNLIDRVRLGYVTDFLLLHFGTWTLFVFNLADAALTLGPVLLVVVYLWPAKPTAAT